MKILVTGGAGFIGSHIVEHFQGKASEIRVLDNLRTGFPKNLDGFKHTFISGSITDKQLVKSAVQDIDYIFHMAAMVSVPESMIHISECIQINVNGTLNILEAASDAGVKKIVFASSAAIYGDNPSSPKIETMCPAPKSPYAITKLDAEYYLEMFHAQNKILTTSFRFFNVFGPRQDPKGAYAAAVPIFMEHAQRGKNIVIHGDGGQTRDFIYVKDVVEALAFGATKQEMKGSYNVGYGEQTNIQQLVDTIMAIDGTQSLIEHKPSRAGDIRHSLASVDKLKATGWKPTYNLEYGLAETYASFKKAHNH
jgi:UDP-glucose 4-epimerase